MEPSAEGLDDIPPTPLRVARRGMVLYMVASRAMFERTSDRSQAALYRSNLLRRLEEIKLQDELEDSERDMLYADIGALDERAVINGTWRYEGAGVLAWALGRLELPAVEKQMSDRAVGDVFFEYDFDEDSSLRPQGIISAYEELMYNLHWRVRHFQSQPGPHNLEHMLEDTPNLPGVTPVRYLETDLAIGRLPISRAPADAARECLSIVQERRLAASWLCGHHPVYSEVPLDT